MFLIVFNTPFNSFRMRRVRNCTPIINMSHRRSIYFHFVSAVRCLCSPLDVETERFLTFFKFLLSFVNFILKYKSFIFFFDFFLKSDCAWPISFSSIIRLFTKTLVSRKVKKSTKLRGTLEVKVSIYTLI